MIPLTLVCAFVVIATLNARNASGTTAPNNSGVQVASNCRNMYTYNSFYAGANKKLEALLLEVKSELSEIREEIKSMKENKTSDKGIFQSHIHFQLSWQGKQSLIAFRLLLIVNISKTPPWVYNFIFRKNGSTS